MVAKAASSVTGPALLHVGERSPKDKNFETSEIVLAAPGTVVAPIPKGMKVDDENGLMLILMQLLKAIMGGGDPMAMGGDPAMAGAPPVDPAMMGAMGGGGPPMPMKRGGVVRGRGVRGMATGGYVTSPNDPYAATSAANALASTAANYNLGSSRLGLDTQTAKQNYGLAQQQLAQSQQQFNTSQANSTVQNSMARQQQMQMQQMQDAFAREMYALQQGAQSQNYGNMVSQANAEMALQRELANAAQSVQRYGIDKDYAAAMAANRINEMNVNNQFALGNRGLDIESADDEFARIMRGVSEASVQGVRGGTPTTGIYG